MSGMTVKILEIECPHCGAKLELADPPEGASETALTPWIARKIDEHLAKCDPSPLARIDEPFESHRGAP